MRFFDPIYGMRLRSRWILIHWRRYLGRPVTMRVGQSKEGERALTIVLQTKAGEDEEDLLLLSLLRTIEPQTDGPAPNVGRSLGGAAMRANEG